MAVKKIITLTPNGSLQYGLGPSDEEIIDFEQCMLKRNAYIPAVDRVIYNLKTTDTKPVLDADGKPVRDEKGRVKRETVPVEPVLATIVYFRDGTKVSVVNSGSDVVKTEQKEITYVDTNKDGKEVTVKTNKFATVATEASKEAGFVYALVKRIAGKIDKDGNVDGNGLGRKLRTVVNSAYDTQYQKVWKEVFNELCFKEHKEREAAAKARKEARKPSFEENLAFVADYLRKQAETKMA